MLKENDKRVLRWCEMIHAPDWMFFELKEPKDIHQMKIRPTIKGKKRAMSAWRVLDVNPYPPNSYPYKGGLRLHPNVTVELLRVLARDMTYKCSWVNIPFGGAKGGAPIDPSQLTEDELRDVVGQMTTELFKHQRVSAYRDVPGPDMGVNERIIDWMLSVAGGMDGADLPPFQALTGKSLDHGGLPGREEATARGGLDVLEKYLELSHLFPQKPTLAIQGFGNVGENLARLAYSQEYNYPVVAVSDKNGGIYAEQRLDISAVRAWMKEHHTLAGYPNATAISNEDLLLLPVDVLVPAALENQITDKNASRIQAKFIMELANEAITPAAYDILQDRNIPVLPGIVANPGGVVGSFLEWSRNLGPIAHKVDRDAIYEETKQDLRRIMQYPIPELYRRSQAEGHSLDDTAHMIVFETLRPKLKERHGYKD